MLLGRGAPSSSPLSPELYGHDGFFSTLGDRYDVELEDRWRGQVSIWTSQSHLYRCRVSEPAHREGCMTKPSILRRLLSSSMARTRPRPTSRDSNTNRKLPHRHDIKHPNSLCDVLVAVRLFESRLARFPCNTAGRKARLFRYFLGVLLPRARGCCGSGCRYGRVPY